MFQPFEKFRPQFINRLIHLNKPFLVAQTYKRAFDHFHDVHKIDILVTDYDDSGLAKNHLNSLKGDKYAALIDLKNEKHVARIREMLAEDSPYCIYWAIVKSARETTKYVDKRYAENVRRYIKKYTDWKIDAGGLKPDLKVIFGELYMILRYKRQHELRVKFEDIEKV